MPRKLSRVVAMIHVADCKRSLAFYEKLGFSVENTHEFEGELTWAWLESGGAHLMVTRADEPLVAGEQPVLFYLYADNTESIHAELAAAGVEVGPIEHPFYAPQGEFRVVDPDGYVLMFSHD